METYYSFTIFDLPEIILNKIFELACVSSESEDGLFSSQTLVNLENTCRHFREVIILRSNHLCKTVKFNWNQIVTPESLKSSEDFIVRHGQSIHVLDLTDCYYLSARTVLNLVWPLPNLKELNVAGINIPWTFIFQILKSKSLEKISFTWDSRLDETNAKYVGKNVWCSEGLNACPSLQEVKKHLLRLRYLTLHLKSPYDTAKHLIRPVNSSLLGLTYFISSCGNLEDLTLLSWEQFWDGNSFNEDFVDIPQTSELLDCSKETGLPSREAVQRVLSLPYLKNLTVRMTESPGTPPVLVKCLIHEAIQNAPDSLTTLYIDHPDVEIEIRNSHWESPNVLPGSPRVVLGTEVVRNLKNVTFSTIPDGNISTGHFCNLERFYLKGKLLEPITEVDNLIECSSKLKFFGMRCRKLDMDWEKFISSHTELTKLCIFFRPSNGILLTSQYEQLSRLNSLKKVSLPYCCLSGLNKVSKEEAFRMETGLSTFISNSVSKNKLEELEIGFDLGNKSSVPGAGPTIPESLELIGSLRNLQRLTLFELNLELEDAQFLEKISKSCLRLKSLKLISVADSRQRHSVAAFIKDFLSALRNFECLEDLKFDQRGPLPLLEILTELSAASVLSRVYIAGYDSNSNTQLDPNELCPRINSIFKKCSKLTMLYLVIPGTSSTFCAETTTNIQNTYSKIRLGLYTLILNGKESPREMTKFFNNMPSQFLKQMVRNDSLVY